MTDKELIEMIQKYDAQQREQEVIWFYREVEKIKPKVILEIGNKEGGNLKILSTHLDSDGMIIGIDQRKEIPWQMDDCECSTSYISGSSHDKETKDALLKVLDGQLIDVLFIDGDHSFSGMIADYEDYSPLVREGGIIAIHDIHYLMPVHLAWEKVSKNSKQKFETEIKQESIGIGYLIKE